MVICQEEVSNDHNNKNPLDMSEISEEPLMRADVDDGRIQVVVNQYIRLMNKENCDYGCYDVDTASICCIHTINGEHVMLYNQISLVVVSLSKGEMRVFLRTEDRLKELNYDEMV